MKNLFARFLLIWFCYLGGQTVIAAILQRGEDMGLGFWPTIGRIFNVTYYSIDLIAIISAASAIIWITDAVLFKPVSLWWLAAISIFSGAYYLCFFVYNYNDDFDEFISVNMLNHLPRFLSISLGTLFWLAAALLPMILLIVVKSLTAKPRRGIAAT